MIICLGALLPIRSSDFAASRLLIAAFSCTKWGLHGSHSHLQDGELLPRLFILTSIAGGIFLLHFPSSHLDWPLTSTLPYGARTFLIPYGLRSSGHLALLIYHCINNNVNLYITMILEQSIHKLFYLNNHPILLLNDHSHQQSK